MMNEWIAVSDRLPAVGEYTLMYEPPDDVAIELGTPSVASLEYVGIRQRWPDGEMVPTWASDECMYAYATHWMPLPEPPKDE